MMYKEKDTFLEKAYQQAQELEKRHSAELAYQYLMNMVHYKLYGEFKRS